tara:strand:- start:1565 stop:2389 length:825 start_codon:yes stop_codon:yes gene_type:complete
MQSLKLQVSDLIPNSLTDAQIEDILNASAKVVLDSLPNMLLSQYTSTTTTSSSEFNVKNKRIIKVVQANYSASPKDASLEHWLGDADSIHYADATSPMFVVKSSGVLKCYPTGTEATVDYIGYPVIDAADTSIGGVTLTGILTTPGTDTFLYANHYLSNGDVVYLSDFATGTNVVLNGLTGIVEGATTNDFRLQGVAIPFVEDVLGSVAKVTKEGQFPDTAEYAVVLGSAIKVAQVLLGEIIHTSEDIELASAMQLEAASLQSLYTTEMQRLIG